MLKKAIHFRPSILWIAILLLPMPHALWAQHISPNRLSVYVQADTIKIDASIDSLFSKRTLDAIESGMTASIVIHFRLLGPGGNHLSETVLHKELEHDIWEGTYRLVHQRPAPSDTLVTSSIERVYHACANLQGIALAALPLSEGSFLLQTRIFVNPISPEQQERTRRWLKILEKGSLLEFFFSLDKPTNAARWIDLLTFRPSVLPHLLREARP